MLAELIILIFLGMVFLWFWKIEPKYGHYIPTIVEPWERESMDEEE